MTETPSPGMWITQNLIKNQGNYKIMRVHHIDSEEKDVHFDLVFDFAQFSARQTPKLYCRGYSWDFDGDLFNMPLYVFKRAMFQSMKRPRPEMRRAMIMAAIEGKKKG
jgi:hypothetical protein